MEQKRLNEGKLLDGSGNLVEAGYAFSLVKDYHRKDIVGLKTRIKEWDYYYIGNHDYAIALTIDDNSYMSLCSVTFFDYRKKTYLEKSSMHVFTFGKVGLPEKSSAGNTEFHDKNVEMHFDHSNGKRHIYGAYHTFEKKAEIDFEFMLEETSKNSMVIATPFSKKGHFYYNQKINNMKAKGWIDFKGERYSFSEDDSRAVLDWGRGVWTRKNTWYWASLNDVQDGHNVGFNLGYGFGDTSAASENMFFYDDKAYKLEDVVFDIQKEKRKDIYDAPWKMKDKGGNIDLDFTPLIVRKGGANILIINSRQRQVFGIYNGTIKAEGKTFEIKDLLGFAEKVYNKW